MKFLLVLCFIAGMVASLQASAVESATADPKVADADPAADEATVTPTEAADVNEECHQPKETGRCFALFYRYAYNVESRQCEEFIYGGCSGNKNNFESKQACEEKCLPKESNSTESKEDNTETPEKASDDEAPAVPSTEVKPAAVA